MKNRWLSLLLVFVWAAPLCAFDGFYVGGQVGHVGLSGNLTKAPLNYSNTIGFGVDLGFRTNSMLDVIFNSQYSSHSNTGGIKIFSETLEANYHIWEINDFDFIVGGGPGFYIFNTPSTSNTQFGLHLNSAVDVKATEQLRVGLGFRWHWIFGNTGGDDFYTVMLRFGYYFGDDE
jgi:hypothetical protein